MVGLKTVVFCERVGQFGRDMGLSPLEFIEGLEISLKIARNSFENWSGGVVLTGVDGNRKGDVQCKPPKGAD